MVSLLEAAANAPYIGEAVSQAEHAAQAALRAAGSGDAEVTLAALLHDVGHLLPGLPAMEGWGVVDHEAHGASFLAEIGFSPRVCRLVRQHVDAKRYLCAIDAEYAAALSPASRATLAWQGGALTGEPLRAFEADPDLPAILAIRRADEAAKVPDVRLPPWSAWRALILEHLEQQHGPPPSDG